MSTGVQSLRDSCGNDIAGAGNDLLKGPAGQRVLHLHTDRQPR